MKQFIDKNMKYILIILLILTTIISSFYIIKVINTSSNMSYTLYKETICKIDDCHVDTGLCDVTPPNEIPEEEKECKSNYDKYVLDIKEENKYYSKLLFSSLTSCSLFLVLTIIYFIKMKKD